ncbi:GroES-like protein [Fistulina hepatica ATCC 64428]|uniref:GroES-like protein n=1 Tax=Fistulina hepatica ATCC 64428 TaxID=1128425 RepID=A0A0D7ANF9_9AGAR|nr:GroES-like protein [Fistulina hepatica ATCC 64428]
MSTASLTTGLAAVLHGVGDIRLENRTFSPPQSKQAQVAVVATGLCGSDLHYYTHGRNGDFVVQAPLVLGHEAAGVVTAVGPGVTNLVPGQRVAIEAGIMCGTCNYCKSGRYNLCKDLRFASSAKTFPHLDGTLQARMNHPAHVLYPLPANVSFELAALAEPLSVLVHAARRADFKKGQSALVLGTGAIGLLAGAIAHARGASLVCAVDINSARLSFAKESGFADKVFTLSSQKDDNSLARAKANAQAALAAFGDAAHDGFDVVFECTGVESCIQMAVHAAKMGGVVMLVGMGSRDVMLPLSIAATREVDLRGSFRYANTYPEALELLGSNTPAMSNVSKLITHRFPLAQTPQAFELLSRGVDSEGKMVLKVVVLGDASK